MRQVVCPACGGANRLPDARDPSDAKCGRCKRKLFVGEPAEVSGEQLRAHLRGTRGVGILLDVWAPWCGPCRVMAPQFASAASRLEPGMRLLKLNSEAFPQDAASLHVSGIPTLLLFRNGQPIARQSGAMSAQQIVAWAHQALAGAPA
jgi:thioredoxin 2